MIKKHVIVRVAYFDTLKSKQNRVNFFLMSWILTRNTTMELATLLRSANDGTFLARCLAAFIST